MTETTGNQLRTITEHWDLTYRHAMGETASHFYDVLEREGRLVGRRCPSCQRVLLPPRAFCDRCFVATDAWVDCGSTATLETFTIVGQSFQGLPPAPYCFGYSLVKGADTAILNYIRGIDLTDIAAAAARLKVGQPMKLVFSPERRGRMLDFWFEVT